MLHTHKHTHTTTTTHTTHQHTQQKCVCGVRGVRRCMRASLRAALDRFGVAPLIWESRNTSRVPLLLPKMTRCEYHTHPRGKSVHTHTYTTHTHVYIYVCACTCMHILFFTTDMHTFLYIYIYIEKWASGLGIGFWLRGVQPRTTVR